MVTKQQIESLVGDVSDAILGYLAENYGFDVEGSGQKDRRERVSMQNVNKACAAVMEQFFGDDRNADLYAKIKGAEKDFLGDVVVAFGSAFSGVIEANKKLTVAAVGDVLQNSLEIYRGKKIEQVRDPHPTTVVNHSGARAVGGQMPQEFREMAARLGLLRNGNSEVVSR